MSTYKVIQDIEAEDKLVGPLSLRQFLYAIGAVVGGYLCFLSVQKGAGILLIVFFPLTLGIGFFAVPWKKEQSTEVWALAHLRYYVMPRRRVWNQSGIREYVRIIAKPIERKVYSNGLGQAEVQSRLKALASTIDSRGWAVKGASTNDLSQIDPLLDHTMSDRLVGSTEVPKEAMSHLKVEDDIADHEDMLNESTVRSKKIRGMIDRQTAERHDRLVRKARQAAMEKTAAEPTVMPAQASTAYGTQITTKASLDGPATGQWFVNGAGSPQAGPTQITIIAPGTPQVSTAAAPTEEEKALAAEFKASQANVQQTYHGHMKVLQPLSKKTATVSAAHANVDVAETPPPAVDKSATAPRTATRAPRGHIATTLPAGRRPAAPPKAVAKPEAVAKAAAKPAVTPSLHAKKAAASKPPVRSAGTEKAAAPKPSTSPMTATPDPAILELASNDDLDIATIARQINKHKSPNEVEIRLH